MLQSLRTLRHLSAALLLLCLTALPSAYAQEPSDAPAADTAQVSVAHNAAQASLAKVERDFAAAFAERDLELFGTFLDEGAVFLGPGGSVLRGKAEVLAGWKGYFEGEAPFSWYPTVSQVSGDLGLSQGPVFGADGSWIANFSSVWHRHADRSWKIVFDGAPPCRNMAEDAAPAGSDPGGL